MKTFFIADPHFGHRAIIEYENRPFKTVEEMDRALICNWNRVIGKHDKVYLLGDLSFYKDEVTADIVQQLQGIKYLVLGNHDSSNVKRYYDMGFHRVYDCPIILDAFWMLSHEPLYININTNMPYANIFGHVHASKLYTNYSSQSFCVSAERIGYTPIAFDEIKRLMGVSDAVSNSLSEEQINIELEKGYADMKAEGMKSASKAFTDIRSDYDL